MAIALEPEAEIIPGYRILEPLGRGGVGEVWKCEAPGGFFKALKIVHGSITSRPFVIPSCCPWTASSW